MAIWRYAWRNLWRNSRRSLITLAAVTLSTAVLMASYALMDGLFRHTVDNATNLVTGEVQVHAKGFLAERSLYQALADPAALLAAAQKAGLGAAARSFGYGLVSQGTKSAGALFWGVDPAAERQAFDLAKHLERGSFLAEKPDRGLVVGRKLAKSLGLDLGAEVVVVVQAADGSLGNDLYTVTGILKAAGEGLDRSAAFIHAADFQQLFVSGGRIHEVALNSRGRLPLDQVAALAGRAAPGEEVKTWRDLMPALADMVNLFDVSMALFGAIFFLAAGLGVMNTMLMSTYERIHEFGLLKALGTTPWRIVRDVCIEALLLGLAATAAGTLIGLAGTWYLQAIGLDISRLAGETTIAGVAFDPIWRAQFSLRAVVSSVATMWAICLLAALYPAAVAARLDPVRALNRV